MANKTLPTINKPNNDKTDGKNDQKTASTTNLGTSAGFFDVGDVERNVYGNQNFKQNKNFSSEAFSLNWDQWYLYRYGQPRNPDKKCDSAARRSGNRPTPSPAWAIETPTLKEKDGKKESQNVSPIRWWMRIDQVSFCFWKRKRNILLFFKNKTYQLVLAPPVALWVSLGHFVLGPASHKIVNLTNEKTNKQNR